MKKIIILIILLVSLSPILYSQPCAELSEIANKLNELRTYESSSSYTFSFPYGDPMTIESQIVLQKVPSDTLCGFYYHFNIDENSRDEGGDFWIYFNNTFYKSVKNKIEKISKKEKPKAFMDIKINGGMIPGIHHSSQLYFITPYQISKKITEIINCENSNISRLSDTIFNGKECMRFILNRGKVDAEIEEFNLDGIGANIKYELWFDKNDLYPVYYRRDSKGNKMSQFQYAWFYDTHADFDIRQDYFTERHLLPRNWENHTGEESKPINPGNLVGKEAPKWELPVLNGNNQLSSNSLLGKYVLLEFTATWCGHCWEAAEMMNRLEERFEDNDRVALISVFSSSVDKKEGISKFAENHKIKTTILYAASEVGKAYQVFGYPNFLIISPKGKVLMNFQGYNSTIENNIINVLAEFTE